MLITKITDGYVAQVFDTETKKCVKQTFTAQGDIDWRTTEESYDNEIMMAEHAEDFYHPFVMEQPNVNH